VLDILTVSAKAFKQVIDCNSHHLKPVAMKMKMKNGKLATNGKDNIEVVHKHLNKVYNNNNHDVFSEAAKLIRK